MPSTTHGRTMSDETTASTKERFRVPPGWPEPVKHPNGLYSHEFQGRVIRLAHVTVVPYRQHQTSWTCVVVESTHKSYLVGGYDIVVGDAELGTGTLIEVLRPVAADHHLRQGAIPTEWDFTCDHVPAGRWLSIEEDGTPVSDECWLKSWWDEVGVEMVSDSYDLAWPPGPVIPVEPEPGQWDEAPVLVPAGTESSRPAAWDTLDEDATLADATDGDELYEDFVRACEKDD